MADDEKKAIDIFFDNSQKTRMEGTTIEFTEEAVKDYLDVCIRHWRGEQKRPTTRKKWEMTRHYIDAFQSVRISLFGELLASEKKEAPYGRRKTDKQGNDNARSTE